MRAGAFVNADVIARGLSAFDVESVAFQAGRIMLDRIRELADHRADFAFETTLASRTFAPLIRNWQLSGYRMQLVYVWLSSADLCVQRVRARSRAGGHFVDEDMVRRRYERSLQNLFSLYRRISSIGQGRSGVAGSGRAKAARSWGSDAGNGVGSEGQMDVS